MRLFRCFHWFLRKFIVKLANIIFLHSFYVSRAWTPRAKYFELCKSLTRFREPMCDEYFGQISFKSDKSRLRLIHSNEGNTRKNKPLVFGLQIFSQFSRLIEVAVNAVIPPTNREQPKNPLKGKRDKRPHSVARKLIPRSE